MADQPKTKLFRDKSLEAIESPESLNDYLRVTSPGVWLVLAAVIMLLTGFILWAIFGRIDTTKQVAVVASKNDAVCYVPYDNLEQVMDNGKVTIEGKEYNLTQGGEFDVTIVSEKMDALMRVTGELEVGDIIVDVPVDASLTPGVYAGTVVTESLQPMTLLLQ